MRNILNTKFVRNLKLYTKTNTRSLDTSKQYNGQNKTDSCLFPFGNRSADKDDIDILIIKYLLVEYIFII